MVIIKTSIFAIVLELHLLKLLLISSNAKQIYLMICSLILNFQIFFYDCFVFVTIPIFKTSRLE